MTRFQFLASALFLLLSPVIDRGLNGARAQQWIGNTSTDWNTASNWLPATVPNSPFAVATFGTGQTTTNISASVDASALNIFETSCTLTSSAGVTLSDLTTITITGAGSNTINLAGIATGSLLFPAGNNLTINNYSPYSGYSLAIGQNTVIGSPGNGSVLVGGNGNTQFTGSFASTAGTPDTQVTGGLVKSGPGVFDFAGTSSNLAGGITLNGGTLYLDYSLSTATKLQNGALTLGGGELILYTNGGLSVTQTIPGGTVVAVGHTDVVAAQNNPTGIAIQLNAGSITHNTGGTVDFALSTSNVQFSVTTTTGTTSGLLGTGPAFATVNGGSTWATVSGGAIAGLTTYFSTFSTGTNVDVTASSTPPPGGFDVNSLWFNTGNVTLTLGGANVLLSGGILVTPNATISDTISGGTLQAASSGELLFHIYDAAGFTVNSALYSSVGLTKTGPGLLYLGGNNTNMTGPINVNRGSLYVTNLAAVASASAINFNDNRANTQVGVGLQNLTVDIGNGNNGTLSMPIRLSSSSATDYGTYFSTGNSTSSIITLSGVISSAGGVSGTPEIIGAPNSSSIRFTGLSNDNSGFYLTNTANTFIGNISLKQGYLGIAADGSLGNAANVLNLDINDTANGGLLFLNNGATVAHQINENGNARIVVNGTNSDTISSNIFGPIIKDGTGTLTITNPVNTNTIVNVLNGTLSLGSAGGLSSGVYVTVESGGTFSPPTAANSSYGRLILNGGTFLVPAGTGQQYTIDQIDAGTGGGTSGAVNCTGAGSDQLLLPTTTPISINGNSTWLSPANGTKIVNTAGATIPIMTSPGMTFTNGIALASNSAYGFAVTGGGTLYQDSDATNVLGMAAAVTVSSATTFRVTDASSNSGVGNLGTGTFTLDGGTLDYGGTTASTAKAVALTSNGGTIQVESVATTFSANGAITGPGPLTKTGPGTLVLGSSSNSFTSVTIAGGTLGISSDANLGAAAASVTVTPFGTLLYTATTATARTLNLNNGTLGVSGGATLTLNGASIGGGFMNGAGTFALTGGTILAGVTTAGSATLSVTGPASFLNVTNGSALNIAAGLASPTAFSLLTNQGSGAITVGAGSTVNAANFQTYGMLTLTPNTTAAPTILTNVGTSPLFFDGGSQTFIGTPQTADPTGQTVVDYIDLHGQNAVVTDALFVNNGGIYDTVGAGSSTVIADYGSLVKGAGFYQNTVKTQNGGKFQTGNSPGSATFGNFVFGPGGVSNYIFAIDDATGTAGPSPGSSGLVSGWGLIKAVQVSLATGTTSGNFTWTATPTNPLTVAIDTLVNPTMVGTDVTGPMADFDPNQSYSWTAAHWTGTYAGPTDVATLDAGTSFDTSGIVNPIAGTFGWSLDSGDQTLSLVYTPSAVPEPGTLTLVGLAVAGWACRRRRDRLAFN